MPRSLPLCSLNHISRVAADVEKSKRFYEEVLGFVEIKRPSSFEFEGSWLFNYGIGVHLIQGKPLPRSSRIDPKADHLSFQAESLAEVEKRLDEHGVPYIKACVEEGGVRISQVFFHDPDHALIEVCNCDCLPVMPLSSECQLQAQGHALRANVQLLHRPALSPPLQRAHKMGPHPPAACSANGGVVHRPQLLEQP